jgi:adenylate cyclase class 2
MMLDDHFEVEVKFYIQRLERVEARLCALGAGKAQARVHEYNLLFDTEEGELAQQSKMLRLRQDTACYLTFKGASVVVDGVRQRKEIEFSLDDFDAARATLDELGFCVRMVYEKYRTVYNVEAVLVTLDEMPFGDFIEIEGSDGHSIQEMALNLGLNWEARIQESYADLFHTVCSALGLKTQSLTFETFAGLTVAPVNLGVYPADDKF